jgi:GNAT superfamily N-acetyltransferase
MSETRIEPATVEDLPALADLLHELFAGESDFRPNQVKQLRGLKLIIEQPNKGRIFVIRSYGKLLGMINLLFTISTAEGGAVIILEDLIVVQDHRSEGLGTQLLDYALDFARQKDFQRITLLTDRLDERAKRFFKRRAFQESGMVPMRWLLNPPPPAEPI